MAVTEETYQKGENVVIKADIRDPDTNEYTDPTSVVVSIKDPSGIIKVTNGAMSKLATGRYAYSYPIAITATSGKWKYYIKGDATDITIEVGYFYVEEPY